jgi:hypothetical protein
MKATLTCNVCGQDVSDTKLTHECPPEFIDVDGFQNDVTAHFIADDAYENKLDAFSHGYNQALRDIIKIIKGK